MFDVSSSSVFPEDFFRQPEDVSFSFLSMANDVAMESSESSRMVFQSGTRHPKEKLRKTRRGFKRKSNINKNKEIMKNEYMHFSIIGTNANCLSNKVDSFYHAISHFKPTAILVQESMIKKVGLLRIPGFTIMAA